MENGARFLTGRIRFQRNIFVTKKWERSRKKMTGEGYPRKYVSLMREQ